MSTEAIREALEKIVARCPTKPCLDTMTDGAFSFAMGQWEASKIARAALASLPTAGGVGGDEVRTSGPNDPEQPGASGARAPSRFALGKLHSASNMDGTSKLVIEIERATLNLLDVWTKAPVLVTLIGAEPEQTAQHSHSELKADRPTEGEVE